MSKIDRKTLVNRHNIVITEPDYFSPLTVGNGKFGFTADVTGLQTFPGCYRKKQPLCTMAEWAWHSFPMPEHLKGVEYQYRMFKAGDRMVPYPVGYYAKYENGKLVEGLPTPPADYDYETQTALYNYLRWNPHLFHLGMTGFVFADKTEIADIQDIDQELDMYTGILSSRFTAHGEKVAVTTCAMYDRDAFAAKVTSPLLKDGKLRVQFDFPYSDKDVPAAAEFSICDGNHTEIAEQADGYMKLKRTMDDTTYYVSINYVGGVISMGENCLTLTATGEEISFVAEYAKADTVSQGTAFEDAVKSSKAGLEHFWENGGIIDFGAVADPRAKELESRMVRSLYLTRINNCAPFPPHESGFTTSSWYGASHTEMHYWHAAHFAQFTRPELLDISLNSYNVYMDRLEELAKRQGYKGLRIPKMVNEGLNECPSYIAPLLLWEQPHPILLAELMYRINKDTSVMERYFTLIEGLVEFMLDILIYDKETDRYVLDAPLIPAQEWHDPMIVKNAVYELEYWHYGFAVYKQWCERLGKTPLADLDEKMAKLAPTPVIDGLYPAHENCPDTYEASNLDHPSMLCAYGVLPGLRIDPAIAEKTFDKVLEVWQWDTTWGWDYALLAMTAAKLGRREDAVNVLLKDTPKNRYSKNGHVYQYDELPCYIDTNGALLIALGFLAAGCDSNPGAKFPENWDVKVEGIVQYI